MFWPCVDYVGQVLTVGHVLTVGYLATGWCKCPVKQQMQRYWGIVAVLLVGGGGLVMTNAAPYLRRKLQLVLTDTKTD